MAGEAGDWQVKKWLLPAAVLLAMMSVLAVACGGGGKEAPTPAATATGTAALPLREGLKIETEDGLGLSATSYGAGPTAVILAHMRGSDQRSWSATARRLASGGEYTVLTFDFRGHGGSDGGDLGDIDKDMRAAIQFMRADGFDKVFVVGASMGGTAALAVASEEDLAGVVAISAPAQFQGIDALARIDQVTEPKLFIAASGDEPYVHDLEEMFERAAEPKDRRLFDGNEHGTALLEGDQGEQVLQAIEQFLQQAN
jgi:pimeloyl-ACP methyl ester carboxylesterase